MWIRDFNRNLVNLGHSGPYSGPRSIFIGESVSDPLSHQVIAQWDPDRTNANAILWEGSETHCEIYLNWLASQLGAKSHNGGSLT